MTQVTIDELLERVARLEQQAVERELDSYNVTWFSREGAAAYLGENVRTFDRWVRDGKITKYGIAGFERKPRFKREELDALMQPVASGDSE